MCRYCGQQLCSLRRPEFFPVCEDSGGRDFWQVGVNNGNNFSAANHSFCMCQAIDITAKIDCCSLLLTCSQRPWPFRGHCWDHHEWQREVGREPVNVASVRPQASASAAARELAPPCYLWQQLKCRDNHDLRARVDLCVWITAGLRCMVLERWDKVIGLFLSNARQSPCVRVLRNGSGLGRTAVSDFYRC